MASQAPSSAAPPVSSIPAPHAQARPLSATPPFFETARYVLYALGLVFALLSWTLVLDWSHNRDVGSIMGKLSTCYPFADYSGRPGPFREIRARSSPLCILIVAFGVVLTLAQLTIVAWHSLSRCGMSPVPIKAEAFTFGVAGAAWLTLFAVALAESPSWFRDADIGIRAVIAVTGLAGVCALLSLLVAAILSRRSANAKNTHPMPNPTPLSKQPAGQLAAIAAQLGPQPQPAQAPYQISAPAETNQPLQAGAPSPSTTPFASNPPAMPGLPYQQATPAVAPGVQAAPPRAARAIVLRAPTPDCYEIARYVLYTVGLVFAVFPWALLLGGTRDDGRALFGPIRICLPFGKYSPESSSVNNHELRATSAMCYVTIGVSGALTLFQVALIIWHSVGYCGLCALPAILETLACALAGILWLALFIVALTESPAWYRDVFPALRLIIASMFLAGLFNLLNVLVAWLYRRAAATAKTETVAQPV